MLGISYGNNMGLSHAALIRSSEVLGMWVLSDCRVELRRHGDVESVRNLCRA